MRTSKGFSLIELIVTVAIAALLLSAIGGVISQALKVEEEVQDRGSLRQQAHFAMQKIVAAVRGSTRLMVPLAENPNTAYSESLRNLIAVSLNPTIDRDRDGFADADNDKDGLVDEDMGSDMSNDAASGIVGIDDDNDGSIDEDDTKDDDEDNSNNDDELNGLDDDGDGSIDEDIDEDMNDDGKPGVKDVDDDADGTTDEGDNKDDDEDGLVNEDWVDAVVYFLDATTLKQRMPDINPVDGNDFTVTTLVENVTKFEVLHLPSTNKRALLVQITLELTDTKGETVSLATQVRVGS